MLLSTVLSWTLSQVWNRYNRAQMLEACDCLKPLPVYFDFIADAAGVLSHQLGLLGTDLHTERLRGSVKTLN